MRRVSETAPHSQGRQGTRLLFQDLRTVTLEGVSFSAILGFLTMRTLSKPSTAKCTLEHYTAFLLAEPQSAGCVRLAEVAGCEVGHGAGNRFLKREDFSGQDLFEEARPLLDLEGGVLRVADTRLGKTYNQ